MIDKCNVPDGTTTPIIECVDIKYTGPSIRLGDVQQALDGLISKHANPDPEALFIYMTKETYDMLGWGQGLSYKGYKFRLLNNWVLDKGVVYLTNQLELL